MICGLYAAFNNLCLLMFLHHEIFWRLSRGMLPVRLNVMYLAVAHACVWLQTVLVS